MDGHLDVAQKHTVVLWRNGILVGLVKGIHLFLGGANRTYVALTDLHELDMAPNLLRKTVPVLGHAETQLGANRFLESGKVDVLATGQLSQVGVHPLVYLGVGHHDGVAVYAGKQNLLLDHLIQHIVLLLLLRHGRAFRSFLELVKVVQEL